MMNNCNLGNWKTDEKFRAKTWTPFLAKKFHPGQPQVNLGQKDLREREGGRIGERERGRECER